MKETKKIIKEERLYRRARKKVLLKRIKFIPLRFTIAMLIMLLEFSLVIGAVVALTLFVPYFYILVVLTQLFVAIMIINSKDNPDYKSPWLFFVLMVPIIGFMSYFMFYSRELTKSQSKQIPFQNKINLNFDDSLNLTELKAKDNRAFENVTVLKNFAYTHLYKNTNITYFQDGREYFNSLITDLEKAEKFIFMEYFIIENGVFWNTVLDVLEEKVRNGVEVKIVYDDIGCMKKLPSRYYKTLTKRRIKTVPFSKLKGQANNRFNNRSHRKMTIIDGKIAYTGGINIADEYINEIQKFGHWKDCGIKLEGQAIGEMTKLFIVDFNLNSKQKIEDTEKYFVPYSLKNNGFCVPFGDGPKPAYSYRVSKTLILNLINQAEKSVLITTPYLIIDTELEQALENAAFRSVDVKIITPHIPDKKSIFLITKSYYPKLLQAGVKIFEYAPGFIHSKMYIIDGKYALIGTVNMDYRSLVHHFENSVFLCRHKAIKEISNDFEKIIQESVQITEADTKTNIVSRFIWSLLNIFAPLF